MTASWTHWQRLEWLSEDTLLVHFPNPTDVATAAQLANLVQALFADRPDWLWDVTPGFGKLLVHYRPDRIDPLTLEQALSKALRRAVATDAQETQSVIEIPVCYDPRVAPDLAHVATYADLSIDAVVALHCSVEYRVLAVGFALGFAYMGPLPAPIQLPRKRTPRTQVPAGSVAIAEAQTTVYPIDTPGGWHLIGRTHQPLVRLSDTIDLTLPLGSRVRFTPISYAESLTLENAR